MNIKGNRLYDDDLPSFSILIPAYNCGKYIQKTLLSIFDQKYAGKIEIVIGYDTKSTDDTLEKIQNICSHSPHDVIIDFDNDSSIGVGRNRIFKFATGDYVLFVDSDDLITNTLVQNVVELFDEYSELQVVSFKHKIISEKKATKYYNSHCGVENPKHVLLNAVDVMHAWWMSRKCTICAWGYAYKRNFLIENDIVFPDYSHGEDQIFVLRSMLAMDKIGFLKMVGYIYIVHKTSVSNSERSVDKFWNEHHEYRDDYYKLVADKYPSFYSIAFLDYERWYVYRCARLDYKKFIAKIKEKHIKNIPVVFGSSLIHTVASILFNISKHLFWIISHTRFKIRKWLDLE